MGNSADDATTKNVESLKQELMRVSTLLFDGGNCCKAAQTEAIKEAIQILTCLKKIHTGRRSSTPVTVPEHFLCPLSKKIMRDPVVLTSSQTYERENIERWLEEIGDQNCLESQEIVSHIDLTPNNSIGRLISQWCKDNQVKLDKSVAKSDKPN